LKVVHIIEALGGGVYTYFKDLSFFFGARGNAEGIETYIIYSGHRKEIDPDKIKEDFHDNVTLIEVSMAKKLSPVKDLKAIYMLYKELKKINPDVVHLHSSKASVLGRVANFLLFKKSKVFYTPHGYAFLQTNISNFSKILYKTIEKYIQLFFGGTTIACGDTEYEIAKSMGKAALVRNGIPVNNLPAYTILPEDKRMSVGIIGRITFQKAPSLFNEIANRFPQYDFIWIGDGELRHELTGPNITVTGWFHDPEQVLHHLAELDVYLQTSLWEGLPIAVLEAMAMKKPVLATNVIGNKDTVVQGKTGFLFDAVDELDAHFKILEDKAERQQMGSNGFERCRAVFDINKNFKGLIDLYKQ
jgi:glycosyltransferase involved in cell wall biosynthesis